MIKVKKIEPEAFEHFDSDGNSLGFLNEYENTDLRCQIAEHYIDGYYLMFEGKRYDIMPSGKINNWPHGLYDVTQDLIAKMFKANIERNEKNN